MAEPAIPTTVNGLHAQKLRSFNVDVAQGRAIFVFEGDGAQLFALTLEIAKLNELQTMIADIKRVARQRGMDPGRTPIHYPREVTCGATDDIPNHVMLWINPNADDQILIGLKDDIALGLSVGMETSVTERMSQQDRVRHLASKSKVLVPTRKLILPGQH